MLRVTAAVAVASALAVVCNADTYLHNMRGSNNRLDEARRDRNNANRCVRRCACKSAPRARNLKWPQPGAPKMIAPASNPF